MASRLRFRNSQRHVGKARQTGDHEHRLLSNDRRELRQGSLVMAEHIEGPLYYERMGRTGPVMAFVHPNPMDQSCWIYQMARFSTWFRCVAIDIPGYGRSPAGTAEMSRFDMAEALWEALGEVSPGEPAVRVGCAV